MAKKIKVFGIIILAFIAGIIMSGKIINADELQENENLLLNYLEINGPEYIYEFEEDAVYTLKINKAYYDEGNDIENNTDDSNVKAIPMEKNYNNFDEYSNWTFQWKSSNQEVAQFKETLKVVPSNSCTKEFYPTLERPNYFKIKKGTTVISCTINDDEGNKITLTKPLTVLKGTPIKSVKIGKHKMKKYQRYTDHAYIYTNEKKKNAKVSVHMKKNWIVKDIRVDRNQSGIYKSIKDKKKFSLNTNRDIYLKIKLQNTKTKQDFTYYIDIVRYKKHKIKLGKLKNGSALICQRTAWEVNLIPRYTVILKFDKNSKKNSKYGFKSGKDLAKKLKKYWGYTNQTLKYEKGVLTYKETWETSEWIYCKTKDELTKVEDEYEKIY